MSEYYLRNKKAGFLGNSPMWYAKDGQGYTAYVMNAERFSKEAAEKLVNETHGKYEKYLCKDVDARLHLIFDEQDKQRLGTGEPCAWPCGYASEEIEQLKASNKALSDGLREALDKWESDDTYNVGEVSRGAIEDIVNEHGE